MEYRVKALLNNGYGLARQADGSVIFIFQTLPGEMVSVDATTIHKKKGVYWAEEPRLLTTSPKRVQPNCPHYSQCGGCATLHIHPQSELLEKAAVVRDTLKRIAKIPSAQLRFIDFPQNHSRFRGKFHAANGRIGFKAFRDNRIIAIQRCHVLAAPIQNIIAPLNHFVKKAKFEGEIYFACDLISSNVSLTFKGHLKNKDILASWTRETRQIKGASLVSSRNTLVGSWGEPGLLFEWQPFSVTLHPMNFFQSNPFSWPAYHQQVDQFLQRVQPEVIWDVHAGSGFLTSRMGGRYVLASEPDPMAYQQLTSNMERLQWKFESFNGTAEQGLSLKFWRSCALDAAVLDPPRTGLEKPLRDWLNENGPPHLLYFSCDLATFCRDLSQLQKDYALTSPITVMNVNPGTLRVELATTLSRTAHRSHF